MLRRWSVFKIMCPWPDDRHSSSKNVKILSFFQSATNREGGKIGSNWSWTPSEEEKCCPVHGHAAGWHWFLHRTSRKSNEHYILFLKWDIPETMAFIMFIFNMIYLTLQVKQSVDISSNIDYSVGIISVIFYQCKYLLVILYNNQFQFNMKFMIFVIESFSRMINLDLYLNDIANFLTCLLSPLSFI